jgi:type VI protein secretion system component VasK
MLFPRFTLRMILGVTTACAVFFLLVGTGYRGQAWAWGAAIGILSLGVVALVHAACFGIVWCFAQLSAAREPRTYGHERVAAEQEAAP